MKNKIFPVLLAISASAVLLAGCSEGMYAEQANRPIITQESIADPWVIKADDRYYRYGTHWIYFHQNARSFNFGLSERYAARGRLLIDEAGMLSVRLGVD